MDVACHQSRELGSLVASDEIIKLIVERHLGILTTPMGAEPTNVVVVMVTTANQDEAVKIADQVIKSHLAACVSTIPLVHSTYWWEGKIVNDEEALVLIKTTSDKYLSLQETIQKIHSYKVPEIIAIPVSNGFLPYLEWVHRETA